jgi:penicillin-binding protein 1A
MVDHTTGEVLAHVGGRNYADAPFDFVTQGRRPAGTVFFPFVYTAGFQNGLSPATPV